MRAHLSWGLIILLVVFYPVAARDQAGNIKIYDAVVIVPLRGVDHAHLSLRLQNNNDNPVTLTMIDAEFARKVNMFENGRRVASITIPAHALINFTRETSFFELEKVGSSLQTGDRLLLRLFFDNQQTVIVEAIAKSAFDQPHD